MAGANSRIADSEGIDYSIGLDIVLDVLVFQGLIVLAGPSHFLIEAADDGLLDGFAAHIHRDGTGGEYGTVAVSVDFLEDEAQHGGVDECLGLFLYFFGTLAGEVVGIKELQ